MAAWELVPSLVALRSEFNALAPNRDKASDGAVGDAAHQQTSSDHNPDETSDALRDHDPDSKNEVHAIDVDRDLREPGVIMEDVVQHILSRCRSGAENRLKYVIFDRRIWSASSGWRQNAYNGSNPHDHHAHFSASYATAREADTRSWTLEDLMAIDYNKIREIIREEIDKRVDAIAPANVPTAEQVAEAVFRKARTSLTPMESDTAKNLTEARITEAVIAGKAVERYPSNVNK